MDTLKTDPKKPGTNFTCNTERCSVLFNCNTERCSALYQPINYQTMLKNLFLLTLLLAAITSTAQIPIPTLNYDEAQVPQYQLPDPLITIAGKKVTTKKTWEKIRRPELLKLFAENIYGKNPTQKLPNLKYQTVETDKNALNGKATRKQIDIILDPTHKWSLLIYIPNDAQKPTPIFFGLNFLGNYAIHPDSAILVTTNWVYPDKDYPFSNQATGKLRGKDSTAWQVEKIINRGYAIATMYAGDIDPDFDDGFQNGLHPLFYTNGQTKPKPDEWGTLGAWAYGMSRVMDYLQTDPDIDPKKVVLIGHSRLGKATIWAGAQDPRFAMLISNESGEGGAALARRLYGERTINLNTQFPHWFCKNFHQFNQRENDLPVDQHELIALIAPRPVYIASAEDDRWSDPKGEFLAAYEAGKVYQLYNLKGLPNNTMPQPNQPITGNQIGYHIRSGKHNVLAYDWEQYLNFADAHFKIIK